MPLLSYFNSIKVRLKHKYFEKYPSRSRFQFHKGTIKTVVFVRLVLSLFLFQFHKGTIKTR